jgi:hypothetical protein
LKTIWEEDDGDAGGVEDDRFEEDEQEKLHIISSTQDILGYNVPPRLWTARARRA